MYPFAYHRPTSLPEALAVLRDAADGRLIAGGMSLLPALKQRLASPSDIVDLGGLAELRSIRLAGVTLEIGALATHDAVATSPEVGCAIPALAALAGGIGDPQVRNRGTLGGSLATNDPAADYPAAVLALNAVVHTDRRAINADDFFKGMFETALAQDEIITRVSFPLPSHAAYARFQQPASSYTLVGAFVARTADGVRVAVTGAGPSVFRPTAIEKRLAAAFAPAALDGLAIAPEGLNTDVHGSAEYRAHLVTVMVMRAVAAA